MMDRNRLYLPGLLYTGLLEPLLRGIRRQVLDMVLEHSLFPLLDLCCGPAAQAEHLIRAGKSAVGLDINLKVLKYAVSRLPGAPLVCADAALTPFRAAAFKGVIISFALHEKEAAVRGRMLEETKRLLAPGGRVVLVDYEPPWDVPSRRAYVYVSVIERLAGKRHFRQGREFLRSGGLSAELRKSGLREEERRNIAAGTCAIVLAVPDSRR
jgi:demethylmenaquinone methyltransferase/2-methoxy-6-polyprenyl-1,4-benzoquinol methylase